MAAVDPKAAAAEPKQAERRLAITDYLDWLVEDKMVSAENAEKLKKERRYYRGALHPLALIADQKWKDERPPNRPLALETLTEWMAKRVGMEYRHIDPLKIDMSAVTEVMSSSYAARFKILPVAVTSKEVVVAVTEPYLRDW